MTVSIVIDGRELRPPIEYQVDLDMLEPADAFNMTLSLDAHTVALARLDAPFQIFLDDAPIMSGWLEDAEETEDGRLVLRGLDKVGRLCAESLPGAGMLLGSTVAQSVQRIIAPIYERVEFSNADNRRLVRGRGRHARVGPEPGEIQFVLDNLEAATVSNDRILQLQQQLRAARRPGLAGLTAAQRRQIPRRIDAGQKRWEALMAILEPLRLLAWSRGDGKALIIATPNHNQAPQYYFEERFARSNVTAMSRKRSVADRYSTIEVSGSGRPPGVPAPSFFPAYPGQKRPKHVNRNRIGIADDTTGDFLRSKRLFVVSEAMSQDEAQELAERAMAQGLVNAEQIMVTVPDHGQTRPGTSIRTLYAFDTVARVRRTIERAPGDDTETGLVDRDYLVTRVTLAGQREQGESTRLTLSPLGAALT